MHFIIGFLLLCFSSSLFASSWQNCFYKLKVKSISDSTITVEILDYVKADGMMGPLDGKTPSSKKQIKLICSSYIENNTIEKSDINSGKELIKMDAVILGEWSSYSGYGVSSEGWKFSSVNTKTDNKNPKIKSTSQ